MERDERFQHAKTDPVFAKARRSKKVKVDKRFAGALTDDRFGLDTAPVDKYGRKQKKRSREAELAPFYEVDEAEEDKMIPAATGGGKAPLRASESKRLASLQAMARGDVEGEDSSEDSSEAAASSSEDEDEEAEDAEPAAWDEGLPQTHEVVDDEAEEAVETGRLAVTDCEWSHVRAADIMVILQSLCPVGGRVLKVEVFASEYGAREMDKEERFGPEGIFMDPDLQPEEEEEDEEEDEEEEDEEDEDDDASADEEATSGFDAEKLRKYELSKLRRFFAIATFDSVRSAAAAYASGDGVEFESSSTQLCLSFVPEAQAFDASRLRDAAESTDDKYEPPPAFCCAARQQTKVKCTWDDDDAAVRSAGFARLHAAGAAAADADASHFLAAEDSDDESVVKAAKAKKLRAALGLGGDDDDDAAPKTGQTAPPPLKQTNKKIPKDAEGFDDDFFGAAEADEAEILGTMEGPAMEETPFQRRLRLRAERKAEKRKAKKTDDADEAPAEAKKAARRPRSKLTEATEGRDYDARKIEVVEKLRGKTKLTGKRKRLKDRLQAEEAANGFEFDAADDRFRGVIDGDDRFGVDPSAPDFKKTAAMKSLLTEQSKRRKAKRRAEETEALARANRTDDASAPQNPEINALAKSLSAKLKKKRPSGAA